jgi:hypothetical protein
MKRLRYEKREAIDQVEQESGGIIEFHLPGQKKSNFHGGR